MNVGELKIWVRGLPDDFNSYELTIRKLTKTENENELQATDTPVAYATVDEESKELLLLDTESRKLIKP